MFRETTSMPTGYWVILWLIYTILDLALLFLSLHSVLTIVDIDDEVRYYHPRDITKRFNRYYLFDFVCNGVIISGQLLGGYMEGYFFGILYCYSIYTVVSKSYEVDESRFLEKDFLKAYNLNWLVRFFLYVFAFFLYLYRFGDTLVQIL
eukprot:TRINITY_DN2273_c0_g1_i1.p1 TRINITY_DN2273_c0_g1~~TRINITY_DN2273_c0_g1_i1.p1  ORF type:complete len:149 (+),score=21.45 TRINITY_DN2273_c0_g1_i1:395-841(+)